MLRTCSKVRCSAPAARTLTYVHADACIVIGPLSSRAEPGAHDLCLPHATALVAPKGWDLIRLEGGESAPERSRDDILAIADAVREAAQPKPVKPAGEPARRLRIVGTET